MLTQEQLKAQRFHSAGKGLYRSDEVDVFRREALDLIAQLTEKNQELQTSNDEVFQRVEKMANALNQMRGERDIIQKTMILAQKAADELTSSVEEENRKLTEAAKGEAERSLQDAKAEAERVTLETQAQAENIKAKARAKAEALFEEARSAAQKELTRISSETQRQQQEYLRLRKENAKFRTALLEIVAQQMEVIEQIPEFEEERVPEPDLTRAAAPESEEPNADPFDALDHATLEEPEEEGFHFATNN